MSRIEDGGAVEAGLVERLANGGHTQGPWFVGRRHVIGPRDESDSPSFGMIIGVADVYGDNRNQDSRLIAAAPELLDIAIQQAAEMTRLRAENAGMREALKRFGALAENYEDNSPSDWVGYRGVVYVSDLRRARAALSKASQAEGQTP